MKSCPLRERARALATLSGDELRMEAIRIALALAVRDAGGNPERCAPRWQGMNLDELEVELGRFGLELVNKSTPTEEHQ